jgi:anthraniloyl-CoA monooxygenase
MSLDETIAACERIFTANLGGNNLISNARHLRGSAWLNFNRVLCARWSHRNIVLLGDAAATAHFSVGSGSKLAMESAIALANYVSTEPTLAAAFERYESERRLEVLRLQNSARNSTEWFENVERYLHLDPVQFSYSLLTRSQRISHENLRQRDPEWLAGAEKWFDERATGRRPTAARPPMFVPFRVRGLELANRICVSPMAQYKAKDGTPNDWHLVHYAERAKGGAGMVFTEMTCVSPEGRISPGCTGLYTDEHEQAWKRLVDFVHAETDAKIAIQLGHSGPKGSTQLGWEESDAPLAKDNWEIVGASAVPWSTENQMPRELDRAGMNRIRDEFVRSAEMAARIGFDWLELHYAHGYLMSSFITPLSNKRTDEYGGSLENRMRFPLEVLRAVRKVWPDERPMSVRISAHDWVGPDGVQPQDAVAISRLLVDNGVDLVDVSAGQTSTQAQPVYGRMFQTPFSDRIRNEAGVATVAVGNIYEPDHVNSILMAGRADLVCLARPHLTDPYWTLLAAADLHYTGVNWPKPYWPGRDQLNRLKARADTQIGKV